MGWKFYGHAAVFGVPDRDRDVFAPGCFAAFLASGKHLDIPMLNGHEGEPIGKWLRMHEDGFGLFVLGELNDDLGKIQAPYPGLSIAPINAQGSNYYNVFGGTVCRWCDIAEISIVTEPASHGCRIYGDW